MYCTLHFGNCKIGLEVEFNFFYIVLCWLYIVYFILCTLQRPVCCAINRSSLNREECQLKSIRGWSHQSFCPHLCLFLIYIYCTLVLMDLCSWNYLVKSYVLIHWKQMSQLFETHLARLEAAWDICYTLATPLQQWWGSLGC